MSIDKITDILAGMPELPTNPIYSKLVTRIL